MRVFNLIFWVESSFEFELKLDTQKYCNYFWAFLSRGDYTVKNSKTHVFHPIFELFQVLIKMVMYLIQFSNFFESSLITNVWLKLKKLENWMNYITILINSTRKNWNILSLTPSFDLSRVSSLMSKFELDSNRKYSKYLSIFEFQDFKSSYAIA